MAIIHQATISPSKLELVAGYLPSVPPLAPFADPGLTQVGAYRFDDPAGDVGIETIVMTNAGGALLQMPLTYRSTPLDGAEDALLGTMEHSVLGDRWIYNACREPVYVAELARAMMTGGAGAPEMVETPDGPVEREPSVTVRGSGSSSEAPTVDSVQVEVIGTDTHIMAGDLTIVLHHVLDAATSGSPQLLGTWDSLAEPIQLAVVPH